MFFGDSQVQPGGDPLRKALPGPLKEPLLPSPPPNSVSLDLGCTLKPSEELLADTQAVPLTTKSGLPSWGPGICNC